MAAKEVRGDINGTPVNTEGKPSWFDMGTPEMMASCSSCHIGGGPFEGIVQNDGSVIPYDFPTMQPTNTYDRDFYSYDPDATTFAYYGEETIAGTINLLGDPKLHDWQASGVMEADCLMCHIDPEHPKTLQAADGLKADPNRPRMMIFAERDADGLVTKISLGSPLHNGLENDVVRPYTDSLNRMSRPTSMMALMQLPAANVGEMMQMWVDGLAAIDAQNDANGTTKLPYALYGQNVPKIWDMNGIRTEYCPNPAGPADEMGRLMANEDAINNLFAGFLQYMIDNGFLPPSADMDMMMGMFFNDFIYAYQIKNPMDPMEGLMPIPYGLRAYDQGKFYTNVDDFQASTRDYVRQPLVEGEGIPYSGRPGLAYDGMMFGMGLMMCGDMRYLDAASGMPDTDAVVQDWQNNITLTGMPDCTPPGGENSFAGLEGAPMQMAFGGATHDELPNFFGLMPSAELMGLDLNGNGAPTTYIQLLKDVNGQCDGQLINNGWCAKTYYDVHEVKYTSIHTGMFGGFNDVNSPKWTRVCGSCHIMVKDHGNSEVEFVRKYNLGMSADFVKNGHFVNMTTDEEAEGFDVHMSKGTMGCGSCHLVQNDYHEGVNLKNSEAVHNFLKGTDTAHMVRNDLDNKPRPKNCEQCHVSQIKGNGGAADPVAAHNTAFGDDMGVHMEKVSCQACHIPYKKTWRFRAFDDTLGYFGNFDNRMGYDVLPGGTDATPDMMAFPADYAISPVYGTSPGYGIPHFNMVAQNLDANGSGQVPMDYVSEMIDYFHITKSGDPGQIVNGMPTNPRFDFWKYFFQMFLNTKINMLGWDKTPVAGDDADQMTFPPLYYANGTNGYPQVVTGNPITIMTWVDAAAGDDNGDGVNEMGNISYGGAKILYLREIMATISEYYAPTQLSMDPAWMMEMYMIGPNDTGHATDPRVGKVILKPSTNYPNGYTIYDHTGDMYPELWHIEDVRAMQDALTDALIAEGRPARGQAGSPQPMIFMAAHYFSDTHGVKPANKALGFGGTPGDKLSTGCIDCHGNMATDAGAHRVTDRIINFLPWNPPWFTSPNDQHTNGVQPEADNNHLLVFDHETGAMVPTGNTATDGAAPFIIVDGEVAYIDQTGGNGLSFLGAKAEDILELSHHHALQLNYMPAGDRTLASAIYGINHNFMSAFDLSQEYVAMVSEPGSYGSNYHHYVHADLKEHVFAFGYVPHPQKIRFLDDNNNILTANANVFVYGLNDPDSIQGVSPTQGVFTKLRLAKDYAGAVHTLQVFWQPEGSNFDDLWIRIDSKSGPIGQKAAVIRANMVRSHHTWNLSAGPGRYAAVHPDDMIIPGVPVPAVEDCFGTIGGVAFTDHCNTCVSGNTGLEECEMDCNSEYGGSAYYDQCGSCVEGSTGLTPCNPYDMDNDGAMAMAYGGTDCDDTNPDMYPGNTEVCGDGVDQDCSGADLLCAGDIDVDLDGVTPNGGDCNDANADMYPGNTEVCDDGVDQDCSGADLDCANVDADLDGVTPNGGDCNDTNPDMYPGNTEVCGDGVDQDCSGADTVCSESYTVVGLPADETVVGSTTGLVWQTGNGTTANHVDAVTVCTDLVIGARADWRLPTEVELVNIYSDPTFTTTVDDDVYWTSTDGSTGGGVDYMTVDHSTGVSVSTLATSSTEYIRCVHDN